MSTIWFTSDWHLGHSDVIKYSDRPHHAFQYREQYATVREMNEELVERYNARVAPDDLCYNLGDVGLGTVDGWSPYIKRLNGLRLVTPGNHDPSKTKLLEAGFHFADNQMYVCYNGYVFWLAHIPVSGDPKYRRYERPQPLMPYDIALCGHVHEKWKIGSAGEINVGVDVWDYAPVNIKTILGLANNEGLLKRHEPPRVNT